MPAIIAHVVIMIGRKRSRRGFAHRRDAAHALAAARVGEVDQQDAVLA